MKKKGVIITISIILLFISLFFSYNLFIKFFFNENFIKVPNLIGKDIAVIESTLDEDWLKIERVNYKFSNYSKDRVYSQLPEGNKMVKKGRTIKVWVSKGKNKIEMPDFSNLSLSEARALAENNNLIVNNLSYTHHDYDFNNVICANVQPGKLINRESSISFLISLSNESQKIFMPDIIGLSHKKAQIILNQNGLTIGNISYLSDEYLNNDVVLDSTPSPGTKLSPGTVVDLILNKKGE
ncbi:MAG: PASTA domain-containing protein [Fusobacteriota bacterium]